MSKLRLRFLSSGEPPSVSARADNSYRQLAARMIISALHDLLGKTCMIKTVDRSNAWNWLKHDDYGAITFGWCCEVLGLNPSNIREKIKKGTMSARFIDNDMP